VPVSPTPRVLVIPDGLAERPGDEDTTLDAIQPLALDALARRGAVRRVAVTPDGLHAGSETGLPVLFGWTPSGAVSRGRIEAAAHGIDVGARDAVHRVDIRRADGRPWPELAAFACDRLTAANPDHAVHRLAGHRLLAVGDGAPTLPADDALDPDAAADDPGDRPRFKLWADGEIPPPLLDDDTVVVCAPRSTAAGIARLMGAATVHPSGATGRPGTDVAAKARAAVSLMRDGMPTVIVHVGSPDEAAHDHDPQAKRLEAQRIDRDLLAPLAGVAMDLGSLLAVCPDHGTDPRTGRHIADPVPAVLWGPGVPRRGPDALRERRVAGEPVVGSPWTVA
jgi:2,3-bisphosphoglycerate-independent phosphoglycerate mutase